jgi:hypothetical protein
MVMSRLSPRLRLRTISICSCARSARIGGGSLRRCFKKNSVSSWRVPPFGRHGAGQTRGSLQ